MRLLAAIGVAVLAIGMSAAVSHAQDLPGINTSRAFQLDQLAENHTRLTGEVELSGGSGAGTWQFFADQIDIFFDESQLEASGNVVFSAEDGRIAADRVEFDIDAVTGTFYEARAEVSVAQGPNLRLWGEVIEKVGSRAYRLTQGRFSASTRQSDRWVTVSSATFDLDEDESTTSRPTGAVPQNRN